jgi:hypothetical protein
MENFEARSRVEGSQGLLVVKKSLDPHATSAETFLPTPKKCVPHQDPKATDQQPS